VVGKHDAEGVNESDARDRQRTSDCELADATTDDKDRPAASALERIAASTS
jgi:hypothetical protein